MFQTEVKSKEASDGTMWEALPWEGKPGYHTIMWYNTLKLSGLWHHDPTLLINSTVLQDMTKKDGA